MSKQILMLSIISILMVACSAPGVKPKDANLFQAAGNLKSHEFEKQYKARQLDLSMSKDNLNTSKRGTATLQNKLSQVQQEKNSLDLQIAQLSSDNLNLKKDISRLSSKNQSKKHEKSRLKKKLDKINKDIAQTKQQRQSDSITNQQYKQEIDRLNNEIKALRTILLNQ